MANTSGLAIAALILGILSLLMGWIPFVGWIVIVIALVVSFMAFSDTRKTSRGGKGLAIAGLVMSIIALLFAVLLVLFGVGLFNALDSAIRVDERNRTVEIRTVGAENGNVDAETYAGRLLMPCALQVHST